jgi:hypothetical protein
MERHTIGTFCAPQVRFSPLASGPWRRWEPGPAGPDERLDDLKESVDEVKGSIVRLDDRVHQLQHAMTIAVVAICTMMFAGFGALITLFATHF